MWMMNGPNDEWDTTWSPEHSVQSGFPQAYPKTLLFLEEWHHMLHFQPKDIKEKIKHN